MKKAGNKLLIVYIGLLLFVVGLTFGLTVSASVVIGKMGVLLTILKISSSLIIGFLISVISHEGGHLVCGLISGYRFSSFRILSLMMIKQEGRITLRKFSIPGTGGQCMMLPPENTKHPRYALYLYGGTIANLILATISAPLCFLIGLKSYFSLILIMTGALSLYFSFVNGVPREIGGMPNDAMNVKLIRSDKNAELSLMHQLHISDAQIRGKRLKDMPDEWFYMPADSNHRNALCTTIKVFACNRLMDQERFSEANEQMKALLRGRDNIINIYRYLLRCDRIYCELILNGREANISSLYTSHYKRFSRMMGSNLSIMRTQCAVCAIHDKNKETTKKARQKFIKHAKSSPFKQDAEFELQLVDLAVKKAFLNQESSEK